MLIFCCSWHNINAWLPVPTKGFCGLGRRNSEESLQPKQILRGVNGIVRPGELLAIMGIILYFFIFGSVHGVNCRRCQWSWKDNSTECSQWVRYMFHGKQVSIMVIFDFDQLPVFFSVAIKADSKWKDPFALMTEKSAKLSPAFRLTFNRQD